MPAKTYVNDLSIYMLDIKHEDSGIYICYEEYGRTYSSKLIVGGIPCLKISNFIICNYIVCDTINKKGIIKSINLANFDKVYVTKTF